MNIKPYTAFQTPAAVSRLITLTDLEQLGELKKTIGGGDHLVLGSGSNVLFAGDYHGTVIVNRLLKREIVKQNDGYIEVALGAGENWHDVVVAMTQKGYYGLENLALIPGTVGAAPVQNIGAYGVEIADFITYVQVFDLATERLLELDRNDCQFGYRDSIFKQPTYRDRYIITQVTLKLKKTFEPVLTYQGLAFDDDQTLSPASLLNRIIAIRQSKLPDPQALPNAGSFFKNPVISTAHLQKLQADYPDIPHFSVTEDTVKVPAAWLLETAGFKGKTTDSGAGVYEKHALILVNRGGARGKDIYRLACDMMATVKRRFGIEIVPEVRIITTNTGESDVK